VIATDESENQSEMAASQLGKSAIDEMADLRPKWPFCRWRNFLAKHANFFQMANPVQMAI